MTDQMLNLRMIILEFWEYILQTHYLFSDFEAALKETNLSRCQDMVFW